LSIGNILLAVLKCESFSVKSKFGFAECVCA